MGEVYRARDPRLGREVALKVLPEEVSRDSDRLSRFEQEARAASALNHPNIITIYEIGSADSTAFIAMELVDGKTLRELSASDPLPVRRVLAIAAQVAEGLAKAHGVGIVHRDLKPENLMVSRDGYVKILDFGLAKLVEPESGEVSAMPTLARPETHPGTVLGTVGYMSPEQASGQPLDFRSDQFSFGSILYEVATGRKAFSRKTAAETMSAIIREEPEPIAKLRPEVPPPLRWIIERCMAKDPEERYASTRDLARDLESVRDHISEVVSGAESLAALPERGRRCFLSVAAGVGLLVLSLLAGWAARSLWKKAPASASSFHRLTFRRGLIGNARFAPDGQTILYGATWAGEPTRVYLTRPESPESRPFDFGAEGADVLGVSSLGEMAILIGPGSVGTLARVPLAGGVPRQVVVGVPYASADWAPDGKDLVVVRRVKGRSSLEYPIGRVILDSAEDTRYPRFSPRGDRIAFCEIANTTSLLVVNSSGKERKTLSAGWVHFGGTPCWRPNGEEIWFTAAGRGQVQALYAVNLSGQLRLVTRVPGNLELDDISPDGRVLLAHHTIVNILMGRSPGEEKERDLAWLDASIPADLSSDGKTLVLTEEGEGGGGSSSVYLRKTDGSPAVRLGAGAGLALSPDGNWVLASVHPSEGKPDELVLLPTGPGETKALKSGNFQRFGGATFSSGGERIVFSAVQAGHRSRIYVQDVAAGEPRAISPEGVDIVRPSNALSPDGRFVVGREGRVKASLYPLEGGEARPIVGLEAGEWPFQWSADGRSLYVRKRGGIPIKVWLLDPASGNRRLWREITPQESVSGGLQLLISRDTEFYVYGAPRIHSELYLVEGLR
jgi:Tol biopolymer transport system component/predicted Ser/Thr protein kinase